MEFSKSIVDKAIVGLGDELAWRRADVIYAIDELVEKGFAILGGDVWAVAKENPNLTKMTRIDDERIVVGIIKGKNGLDWILNWHSEMKKGESWDEYVLRSKRETLDAINRMDAENVVIEEFADSIFYNLVFADKEGYEELMLDRRV